MGELVELVELESESDILRDGTHVGGGGFGGSQDSDRNELVGIGLGVIKKTAQLSVRQFVLSYLHQILFGDGVELEPHHTCVVPWHHYHISVSASHVYVAVICRGKDVWSRNIDRNYLTRC